MARGVNKVILVGTLGNDPEVKTMPNGKTVVNINLATNEQWKDKNGQKQESTEWHNVVFFDKLGQIACDYLSKGSLVYIEGKVKYRKKTDQQTGKEITYTNIVVHEMQMLGGGPRREPERQPQQNLNNQFQSPDDIPW